jgi:hypothetical protein
MTPINSLFDGLTPQARLHDAGVTVFAATAVSVQSAVIEFDAAATTQLQAYSSGSAHKTGLDLLRAKNNARLVKVA